MAAAALFAPAASMAQPITEAPAGTKQLFMRSGGAYYTFWGSSYSSDFSSMATEIVYGDDGNVYFPNFISQMTTGTYVVGEQKDGKISVQLPQLLSQDTQGGETVSFFIDRLTYNSEDGKFYASATDEVRSVDFSVAEDGTLTMLDTDAHSIIGVVGDDNAWCGYGDYSVVYEPFKTSAVTAPAGLEISEWTMSYDGKGQVVKIGFDGSDIYIQGIYSSLPESWIKGSVEGETITFPSGQYLGLDPMFGTVAYFCGGRYEEVYLPSFDRYVTDLVMIDEATFSYDAANKVISTSETPFVSGSLDEVRAYAKFPEAVITPVKTDISQVPATPEYGNFVGFDGEVGYGFLRFTFPQTNVDGDLLNTKNLYFRFLVDGEPFLFEPDDYSGLAAATTEIPYGPSGIVGLTSYGTSQYVYFYFDGYESLAIQTINKVDGNEYLSEILTFFGEPQTGVEAAASEKTATGISYFTLSGQKADDAAKGMLIKVETFSDGTSKASKVIVR